MKRMFSAAAAAAAAATLGITVLAQAPAQQSGQSQPAGATAAQKDQQVTIVGCVQREADYRKARAAGRGGVAGTGVGAANEFVLTDASMSAGGRSGGVTSAPASAGSATATEYELTGKNEGQLAQYVGRRVEIMGTLKPQEADASGRPTGGPTAGAPPRGVDVTSEDLKLRELEVASVRESQGTCPAK